MISTSSATSEWDPGPVRVVSPAASFASTGGAGVAVLDDASSAAVLSVETGAHTPENGGYPTFPGGRVMPYFPRQASLRFPLGLWPSNRLTPQGSCRKAVIFPTHFTLL